MDKPKETNKETSLAAPEMALKRSWNRRVFYVSFALAVLAVIILASASLQQYLEPLFASFSSYMDRHYLFGGSLFMALAALSAILSPFSSLPLVPFAVSAWGSWATFFLLVGGWMIGDTIAYIIGFHAGRLSFFQRFVPAERIADFRALLTPRSEFFVVLGVRLALPSELMGYFLGLIKYKFSRYLAATFLAELPFAALAVFTGRIFNEGNPVLLAVWLIILAIGAYFAYRYFRHLVSVNKQVSR
jgi:uncharacterized membrane protein YdjX (TVP38/TMEM64 family)